MTDILSKASGIPKPEMSALWAEVRENQAKLRRCKRHRFIGGHVPALGQKLTCLECGGVMGLTDVGYYIDGYVAGGHEANDIWPDFLNRYTR